MPRHPTPKLHEELPSAELFQALLTRYESFAGDPIAQILAKHCVKGLELHRKEAKAILKNEIAQSDSRPSGLGEMQSRLRSACSLLENHLVREGKGDEVSEAKTDYPELVPRIEKLLKVSAGVKNDTVRSMRKEAAADLNRYVEAEARVQTGGHALFDEHATAIARKLWTILDNGYDGLAICLRNAGISHDPVLATRPTVKTPLRPVLNAQPKAKRKSSKSKKTPPASKDGKSTAKDGASPAVAKAGKNEIKAAVSSPGGTEPAARDSNGVAGTRN